MKKLMLRITLENFKQELPRILLFLSWWFLIAFSFPPSRYWIALYSIHCIMKLLPLRLPKQMYLLPVSEQERTHLLLRSFWGRIFFFSVFILVFNRLITGFSFYYEDSFYCILIQTGLLLFSVWAIVLRKGIYGLSLPESLEEPHTRIESMISIYNIFLFLCEQAVFLIAYTLDVYEKYSGAWLLWIPVLLLNGWIMKLCTRPIIQRGVSYEEIYIKK